MKILIFMSSALEMKGVLEKIDNNVDGKGRLSTINISSNSIDFFHSDPGIFSTSYFLTKQLQQVDYDLVINAGIAGSFSEELLPCTVVRVKKDCFADTGVDEGGVFKDLFKMGLIDPESYPFKSGFLHESPGSFSDIVSELPGVTAVTVNKIYSDPDSLNKLQAENNPDIETMEGAAFFYTCLMENKKCLQLRSVSNFVGERDKTKWDLKGSLMTLGEEINKLLNELQEI
ncbi:MAG: hypothetical protein K9H49_10250 [Bacteroidales bacterium]|nr:hypothetical protein [Bacteroidales bacterium]MCF8389727.1 hypothetical protein [Bacteroidales bacterium]